MVQIMKKMRDDAARSPSQPAGAAASASGPGSRSITSPAVNTEMNNATAKQNLTVRDEARAAEASGVAAVAQLESASERTSDPSASEASVSDVTIPLVLFSLRS